MHCSYALDNLWIASVLCPPRGAAGVTSSTQEMTRPILIGVLFVALIIAGNLAVTEFYKRVWIDEARDAAHKIGRDVSSVRLPHEDPNQEPLSRKRPNPYLVCGYVDGKRFHYDIHDKTLTADNSAAVLCDPRFY